LLRVPPVDAEHPMRLDGLTDRRRRTRRPPWHVTGGIVLAYLVAGALVSGCVTSIKLGKVLLIDSFDNPAAGRISRLVVTPTPHLERSCTLASQGVSGLRPPGQAEILELGKRGPDRRHAPAPGRIRRLLLEPSEDALRLLELPERPA
jgi:hypothetical protein